MVLEGAGVACRRDGHPIQGNVPPKGGSSELILGDFRGPS
jgi:hypothetical protein